MLHLRPYIKQEIAQLYIFYSQFQDNSIDLMLGCIGQRAEGVFKYGAERMHGAERE